MQFLLILLLITSIILLFVYWYKEKLRAVFLVLSIGFSVGIYYSVQVEVEERQELINSFAPELKGFKDKFSKEFDKALDTLSSQQKIQIEKLQEKLKELEEAKD